ncbi:MAG: 4-hydroxy-tetrahydrodipicolinate synthase, partial [Polyangiaceae bacterium]|nr:4-hydroxy-tetrahydrodipicolinate synthase [Polyangiaceae bacterium]
TPFTSDGRLDVEGVRKLARFQLDSGVSGLVPCGTTGESPTLAWEEHDAIVMSVVEAAGSRASVMAGTGSNSTTEAIEATRAALRHGASAALVVDCYYNGPSSLELRTEYYERILEAVPEIPIVPYIIPGRSGCALSAADLAILHLSNPSRVPAVKQATGDLERMREDRALAGQSLAILSGDDDLTVPLMADEVIRASGVISVISNFAPGALVKLVAAQASGDLTTVASLREAIAPLLKLVTCIVPAERTLPDGRRVEVSDKYRNPVPVKTVMAGLGMIGPVNRAPLGRMSLEAVESCRAVLREVYTASPEILSPIDDAFGVRVGDRLADDAIWAALARPRERA